MMNYIEILLLLLHTIIVENRSVYVPLTKEYYHRKYALCNKIIKINFEKEKGRQNGSQFKCVDSAFTAYLLVQPTLYHVIFLSIYFCLLYVSQKS